MSSYYWIKLYDDILDDPKMGRLSDGAFRLCINLFLLAGRGNPRNGELPPLDDTAWVLRLGQGEFTSLWGELEHAGIVGIIDGCPRVLNFEKRQGALTPAEKQKLYRDRKRGEALQEDNRSVTVGVTQRNADIDIETDIDTETERGAGASKEPKLEPPELPPSYLRLIPIEMGTPEFIAAVGEWLAYQHELTGRELPTRTLKNQLLTLRNYPTQTAIAMINQSINQGWKGLFDLRQSANGNGGTVVPATDNGHIALKGKELKPVRGEF